MKGLQGDRGDKGVKGRRGPPVRKKSIFKAHKHIQNQNAILLIVHLSKYAKRFVVELTCFMSQGKPGAVGHRSTTQRQQPGPKPGPRSEPTRTKRPHTERQDDVGASFHFFHCVLFLLVLQLCSCDNER